MDHEVADAAARSLRDAQRAVWVSAAPGWVADDATDDSTSPATERLIALARIGEGDVVLDVACGSGDPALAIARVVGERGRVLAVDIVPEMVEGARRIAFNRGVGNVELRAIADEHGIDVGDASFDAVTCRFGLMFMPNPAAAARTWRAALRPGGRIAVSTWATFPVLAFIREIIARHTSVADTEPSAPGILGLQSADELHGVLQAAGFEETVVERITVGLFQDLPPDAWWDLMSRVAGPLVQLLASLPAHTRRVVREDGIRALAQRHPSGVVSEKGDALLAGATNPG